LISLCKLLLRHNETWILKSCFCVLAKHPSFLKYGDFTRCKWSTLSIEKFSFIFFMLIKLIISFDKALLYLNGCNSHIVFIRYWNKKKRNFKWFLKWFLQFFSFAWQMSIQLQLKVSVKYCITLKQNWCVHLSHEIFF